MKFSVASGSVARLPGELLVLPLFDSDLSSKEAPPALDAANEALGGLLLQAAAQEGFKAKGEQSLVFHTHGKLEAERVLLLGLGARGKFTPEVLRLAAGRAAKAANKLRVTEALFVLPVVRDVDQCVKAAAEGFL